MDKKDNSIMREKWIDCFKGILILLVVLGHVAGAGGNLCEGNASEALLFLRKYIYSFHMPAFFFLAGYVWHRKDDFRLFVGKRAYRLLVPYVIFGIVSWGIYDLVCGSWVNVPQQFLSLLHAGHWPRGEGFRCNSVLWFLPCMFVVVLAYWWLDRMALKLRGQFLIAVGLVWLRAIFWKHHVGCWPWGLVQVPWYLAFLILGRCMRGVYLDRVLIWFERNRLWFKGCVELSLLGLYGVVVHWLSLNLTRLTDVYVHCLMGIIGTLIILLIARTIAREMLGRVLIRCGEASLGIMLIHKFIVVALQERVAVIRNLFHDDTLLAMGGCVFVFLTATAVSYVLTTLLAHKFKWLKIA